MILARFFALNRRGPGSLHVDNIAGKACRKEAGSVSSYSVWPPGDPEA
jgi:hypothetical protein